MPKVTELKKSGPDRRNVFLSTKQNPTASLLQRIVTLETKMIQLQAELDNMKGSKSQK